MVKFSPEMGSEGHEKDLSHLDLAKTVSARVCSWSVCVPGRMCRPACGSRLVETSIKYLNLSFENIIFLEG